MTDTETLTAALAAAPQLPAAAACTYSQYQHKIYGRRYCARQETSRMSFSKSLGNLSRENASKVTIVQAYVIAGEPNCGGILQHTSIVTLNNISQKLHRHQANVMCL